MLVNIDLTPLKHYLQSQKVEGVSDMLLAAGKSPDRRIAGQFISDDQSTVEAFELDALVFSCAGASGLDTLYKAQQPLTFTLSHDGAEYLCNAMVTISQGLVVCIRLSSPAGT